MKKIGNGLRWFFGIMCIIGGGYGIIETPAFGICCVMFGLFLLPGIWREIQKKYTVPKGVAAAIPSLFFVMMCLTVPPAEYVHSMQGVTTETFDMEKESDKTLESEKITPEVTDIPEEETPEIRVTPEVTEEPEITEAPEETAVAAVTEEPKEPETYQELKVHFLDVGQGLAVFAQCGDQTLIYDGGDRKTSSFVVSYLQKQGVTTLDYVISSHYDADHVYGLIGCLHAFDVKKVISSDYEHDSETYRKFVQAVDEEGLSMEHPSVGTEYSFGSGSFTVLAPEKTTPGESNKNSVVVKLVNGEQSFLLTGDAESSSEKAMCDSGLDLTCDVLVPSHHGSATATSWEFLQETVPAYAVISCGTDNQYGHPDKDTMDKLQAMEISVYRTDIQGTVVAVGDGENLSWDQEPCNDYTPGDPGDKGTQPQQKQKTESGNSSSNQVVETTPEQEEQVWISATGEKYHNKPNCGRMNPDNARQMSRSEAENSGYEPCKKCY